MCLARLCEREDLVDGHTQLLLRHPLEHLPAAPKQLFARRSVVQKLRSRDEVAVGDELTKQNRD